MKNSEYKQQLTNIDYFADVVNISLTRGEWNSSITWISSMMGKGCERLSKPWFEDLYWLVCLPITMNINSLDNKYSYDGDISFEIPRELLRMFVYSIGRVAYDFDVKSQVSISAQNIINKVNKQIINQLPSDDKWFILNF